MRKLHAKPSIKNRRLGVFVSYVGSGSENYSLNSVSYDLNGNITALSRNGLKSDNTFGLIDDLAYTYQANSNKIQKVDDNSGETASFTDATGDTDYTYSQDGSLTSDNNKGISVMEYNYLKLPRRIVKNGVQILYQYDATGKKLKETIGSNVTDYNGNTIYKNGALYQISHDEGRIINGEYEYNIKDHLGNLRVAFRDSLGIAKVVQYENRGAWGESLEGINYSKANRNKFNYSTYEEENDFGLGVLDAHARVYDPIVPRFWQIDPKSEKWNTISPFCYVLNNPLSFVDIGGKDVGIRSFANGAEYPIIGRFATAAGNNAFATYLRTQEGYSFVSKYAKANTVLFGVRFEKDGEFSNQLLEFNEVDNLGTALGYTSVIYRDAKNTGFTHLASMNPEQISVKSQAALTINLATPGDVNSMITQMVVLGHESFIHNRNVDKTMRAFNKKDYKNAINIAKQNEEKAGPQGDSDHSEFINNPSHFSNFNSYVDHLRGLSQKYKFNLNILEEQIEGNESKYEKLRKK